MIWGTNKQPKKGLNIELTDLQYEYLHELVMFAYEMDTPNQKGWDMQTFDNLVDNVCNAKETYLSEDVRGDIMEDNIEIIEDGDYKVTIDYENMTTTFEVIEDGIL